MKKILLLTAAIILFSPLSYADHNDYGQRGYGWGHHEHRHHRHQPEARYYPQPPVVYYQQPEVRYYPQPPVRYYQQPQVPYYPQPRQYSGNSLRLSW